jgi:hypothetical protein
MLLLIQLRQLVYKLTQDLASFYKLGVDLSSNILSQDFTFRYLTIDILELLQRFCLIGEFLNLRQLELLCFRHLFDDAGRHFDCLSQVNGIDDEATPVDRHALDLAPIAHPVKCPFVLLAQGEDRRLIEKLASFQLQGLFLLQNFIPNPVPICIGVS